MTIYFSEQMPGRSVSPSRLANVNSYQDDLTALLYQSGYLSVDFPNEEVRNGFYNQLLPIYTSMSGDDVDSQVDALRLALIHGDVETFITEMRAVIASLHINSLRWRSRRSSSSSASLAR